MSRSRKFTNKAVSCAALIRTNLSLSIEILSAKRLAGKETPLQDSKFLTRCRIQWCLITSSLAIFIDRFPRTNNFGRSRRYTGRYTCFTRVYLIITVKLAPRSNTVVHPLAFNIFLNLSTGTWGTAGFVRLPELHHEGGRPRPTQDVLLQTLGTDHQLGVLSGLQRPLDCRVPRTSSFQVTFNKSPGLPRWCNRPRKSLAVFEIVRCIHGCT